MPVPLDSLGNSKAQFSTKHFLQEHDINQCVNLQDYGKTPEVALASNALEDLSLRLCVYILLHCDSVNVNNLLLT